MPRSSASPSRSRGTSCLPCTGTYDPFGDRHGGHYGRADMHRMTALSVLAPAFAVTLIALLAAVAGAAPTLATTLLVAAAGCAVGTAWTGMLAHRSARKLQVATAGLLDDVGPGL